MACYPEGADVWKRTDYTPADVDTAQLYDGFSFQALAWLEALGFCPVGEGGRYIEGGKRIALDGELPLNTFGGQIGAGRLHGFGFAHQAVVPLRANRYPPHPPLHPPTPLTPSRRRPLSPPFLLPRH